MQKTKEVWVRIWIRLRLRLTILSVWWAIVMDWPQKMSISSAWHVNHAHINCLLLKIFVRVLWLISAHDEDVDDDKSAEWMNVQYRKVKLNAEGFCAFCSFVEWMHIWQEGRREAFADQSQIIASIFWVIKHAQNNSIGHVNKSLLCSWVMWKWKWMWASKTYTEVPLIIHLIVGNVN